MSSQRVKGVMMSRKFVYGNTVTNLPPPPGEQNLPEGEMVDSHKWTAYIRGESSTDDLSNILSKVIFNLHPSCRTPTVVLTEPPFQLTQEGWGEFDITMELFFKGDMEKSLTIIFPLRLYHPDDTGFTATYTEGKTLIFEYADELVFSDPPQALLAQLKAKPSGKSLSPLSNGLPCEKVATPTEAEDIRMLGNVESALDKLIHEQKEKYLDISKDIVRWREIIRQQRT